MTTELEKLIREKEIILDQSISLKTRLVVINNQINNISNLEDVKQMLGSMGISYGNNNYLIEAYANGTVRVVFLTNYTFIGRDLKEEWVASCDIDHNNRLVIRFSKRKD